jgi:hypothetical protein
MAENPNDTTQVRDAKAAPPPVKPTPVKPSPLTSGPTAAQVAQEHHDRHDHVASPKGATESQADYDRRVGVAPKRDDESQADYDRRVLKQSHLTTHAVVNADLNPIATPCTLHLMDADERVVLDRVQVRARPFRFLLDGNAFEQVREQPDGSWIYHQVRT